LNFLLQNPKPIGDEKNIKRDLRSGRGIPGMGRSFERFQRGNLGFRGRVYFSRVWILSEMEEEIIMDGDEEDDFKWLL